MALVGVSITKSTSFRGVSQEFSNTYYYKTPLPVLPGEAEALINSVVSLERPMHSTTVSFVRGRCWSAGGTKTENQMLAQVQLSGTGSNSSTGQTFGLDKERAYLVRARAGIDNLGRPVYLRKWFHLDIIAMGGASISTDNMRNTATLSTAQRAQLETWFNSFKSVTGTAQTFQLCSEKGREITGATEAHKYIEHHQLGDMWRG